MPGSETSGRIMFFYVYILESIKRSDELYIGYAYDLVKRIKEQIIREKTQQPKDTCLGSLFIMKRVLMKKMQEGEKIILKPIKEED